jgi:hypothetical protein
MDTRKAVGGFVLTAKKEVLYYFVKVALSSPLQGTGLNGVSDGSAGKLTSRVLDREPTVKNVVRSLSC